MGGAAGGDGSRVYAIVREYTMQRSKKQRFRIHGWKWLKNLYMGLGESASQIRTTFFGSGSLEIAIRAARESCKGNTTLCSYAG